MDEAPEFSSGVLDALREPLESGEITVSRLAEQARFPARFQLVLAANPCPCGMAFARGAECSCTPMARIRYLGRLSGPLLDRVDLRLEMQAATRSPFQTARPGTSSPSTGKPSVRTYDGRTSNRARARRSASTFATCMPSRSHSPESTTTTDQASARRRICS